MREPLESVEPIRLALASHARVTAMHLEGRPLTTAASRAALGVTGTEQRPAPPTAIARNPGARAVDVLSRAGIARRQEADRQRRVKALYALADDIEELPDDCELLRDAAHLQSDFDEILFVPSDMAEAHYGEYALYVDEPRQPVYAFLRDLVRYECMAAVQRWMATQEL